MSDRTVEDGMICRDRNLLLLPGLCPRRSGMSFDRSVVSLPPILVNSLLFVGPDLMQKQSTCTCQLFADLIRSVSLPLLVPPALSSSHVFGHLHAAIMSVQKLAFVQHCVNWCFRPLHCSALTIVLRKPDCDNCSRYPSSPRACSIHGDHDDVLNLSLGEMQCRFKRCAKVSLPVVCPVVSVVTILFFPPHLRHQLA